MISICEESHIFDVHIFVTGMHLSKKFGYTVDEVYKSNFKNVIKFNNTKSGVGMDLSLANTIRGFSKVIKQIRPDLVVIHGDRVEALAGAITSSLRNVLVAHIEGGEVSGTIDELIRHAVSKVSHAHFVANDIAKKRLIQLGELPKSIYVIGSPDLDLIEASKAPDITKIKDHYGIDFKEYAIALFHPVTTEVNMLRKQAKVFVRALVESNKNYILIYPNNDFGHEFIIEEYKELTRNKSFKIFPSIRFEYFLSLLNHSEFIIGNSSAGIREAPYLNLPSIDIGSRQKNRHFYEGIIRCDFNKNQILDAISKTKSVKARIQKHSIKDFGDGKSAKKFFRVLKSKSFWQIKNQKQFQDLQ